jgi:hypothetical protein
MNKTQPKEMENIKTISIAVFIISALVGTYEINTIGYSFAQNATQNPIPRECSQGHNCICISEDLSMDTNTHDTVFDLSCQTKVANSSQ